MNMQQYVFSVSLTFLNFVENSERSCKLYILYINFQLLCVILAYKIYNISVESFIALAYCTRMHIDSAIITI